MQCWWKFHNISMDKNIESHRFNPYKILGIDHQASEQIIKKKFYEQAKIHHPDKGGSNDLMKQLNEAYKSLIDPIKRRKIDEETEDYVEEETIFNLPALLAGDKISDEFRKIYNTFQQKAQTIFIQTDLNEIIINCLNKQAKLNNIKITESVKKYYCNICRESFKNTESHNTLFINPLNLYFETLNQNNENLENILPKEILNFTKIIIQQSNFIFEYIDKNYSCINQAIQKNIQNQRVFIDQKDIPYYLQSVLIEIKNPTAKTQLKIGQLIWNSKEIPLKQFYQQGFLREGLLFYKFLDKFTLNKINWKQIADDFMLIDTGYAFEILEFSQIPWAKLGDEYFKENKFIICLQCLLQPNQIDQQKIIDLAESIRDQNFQQLFLYQAFKFTNSLLALQRFVKNFKHLPIFPNLIYFLIIKESQDTQALIQSYIMLQEFFKKNQLHLAFCLAHRAASLSQEFSFSASFSDIYQKNQEQISQQYYVNQILPIITSSQLELLIKFKELDSWEAKSILEYCKNIEGNEKQPEKTLQLKIFLLRYLAHKNLDQYSEACNYIIKLICSITDSETLLSLNLITSDTEFRDLGIKCFFTKLSQIKEGVTTFEDLIPIFFPQVSNYENIKISQLRYVKKIENGIFKMINEEKFLEAGFSYLDASIVMPSQSARSTSLLLASICFYQQQQRTQIFEESFSLFMLISLLASIFIEGNSTDPTFELNQLQIFLSLLSASSKLLQIAKKRMALINQIQNMKIHYETENLIEMKELLETLIIRMFKLCRATPILETFNITVWDSVFIDCKTSQITENFINKMKNSQDSILSQFLAEYYLFEGACKGWIDKVDFEKNRKILMLSLLQQNGWSANDIKTNLLQNSVLKRTEDNWLSHLPELTNLDPINKYENIQGVELNIKTGDIDFVLYNGEFPVIDINDIIEVNQKGLYDTYFSLDQPDPQFKFHPFQQMRFGPDRLHGTRFLSTMLHADYFLKMILTGVEVNPNPDFEFKPAAEGFLKRLPDFIQKPIREVLEKMLFSRRRAHRFWIEGGEIEYNFTQNGGLLKLSLGEVKMKVKKNLLRMDANGNLVDAIDEDDDSPEAQFAQLFTEFYDLIGAFYPELLRLKELYKLACISRFINRIRSSIMKNIEESKQELMREFQKYLEEERKIYVKTFFLKNTIAKVGKEISNAFPQLQGQVNEEIKQWLELGNASLLLQKLVNAAIDKHYGNIMRNLQNSFFFQQEVEFSFNQGTNICNWVPATFCFMKNARLVYGGVSLFINWIQANVPNWLLHGPRYLITQALGLRTSYNGACHSLNGIEHENFPNNNSTFKDQAEKVYVIRKPLRFMLTTTDGVLAHSALLIKSKDKDKFTIVEYMDDSKVHYRIATLSDANQKEFKEGKMIWKKQEIGVSPQNKMTVEDIKNQMEKNMNEKKYDTFSHNCHIAQESTRLSLGLVQNNKLTYKRKAKETSQKSKIP